MPAACPPETRARAIELAQQVGVTAAAEATGVSKGSVSMWCKEAGVQTVQSERTAKAVAAIRANAEERKARLADRLLEIAEAGTDRTLEILSEAQMRDLVGAWTRAIHDAQLLSGGATSRPEHKSQLDAEIERLAEKIETR